MSQAEISQPPRPSERTIDVRITIDADSLPQPQDPGGTADPTSIDQDQGYMVVTGSREAKSQGAGEIVFEAAKGDTLRFFISSGSNNFEQVILIESILHTEGDKILTDCTGNVVEQTVIVPGSSAEILPGEFFQRKFQFFRCSVAGSGTGSYDLVFALYGRSEQAKPEKVSHYRWAMRLTANSNRRES